jgi:methylated-DNA-[protein]-cysteine S-methyltransferase
MKPTFLTTTLRTPFGPFSLAVDTTGALIATAFGDLAALRRRLKPECHLISDKTAEASGDAAAQLADYFAGRRRDFSLRLAPHGTAFQHAVWAELGRIPPGATRTYGQLAAGLGQPGAARAVGRANATNPICVVVPCHRVIGADGSLTGFAFGETIKRRLLDHERTLAARARAA